MSGAPLALCLVLTATTLAEPPLLRREGPTLRWGEMPVQLVGYSYYGLLGDRTFDHEAFLERLAAHSINFTRFFLLLPWPVEPGPNLLPFARVNGKFDLRQFDAEFFARLRSVVTRAQSLGIICQICIFDRCGLSQNDRLAWRNNPYNGACNVNGLLGGGSGGYPDFCRTRGPIADVHAALVKKVVDTTGDARNVIYEIMNEPYPQLGPLRDWHAFIAKRLREALASQPGSKVIASTGWYDVEAIDMFSMHRAASESLVSGAIRQSRALGRPVILSDDGDAQSMFHPDITVEAARRALAMGQHFEHLAFTLTLQRERERRAADHLDELPGHCLLNLRTLATLSTPLLDRPYIRGMSLRRHGETCSLEGDVENARLLTRILAQRSRDGGRSWSDLGATLNGDSVATSQFVPGQGQRTFVRFICVDRESGTWPGPPFPCGPAGEWRVRLGAKIVEAGLLRIRPNVPDGVMRRALRGGRPCHEVDLEHGGKYAYFRLDPPLESRSRSAPVAVGLEVFDSAGGSMVRLEYDGHPGAYTGAPPFSLGGSGEWRTIVFELEDVRFAHGQNDGADLRVSLEGGTSALALGSVSVSLRSPGSPGD